MILPHPVFQRGQSPPKEEISPFSPPSILSLSEAGIYAHPQKLVQVDFEESARNQTTLY